MENYNKINYNNFLKILSLVFKDVNIRHNENFKSILFINFSIYKDKYMEYIECSRDIILLATLKTIIEQYDFYITYKDNNTLYFSKGQCILTSKSNNINTLYNNLKYLNKEYNRIVNDMENNLKNLTELYFKINYDNLKYSDNEIDKFKKEYDNLLKKSFQQQHLYFCVKFLLCNLSSINLPDNIDKDLVIQRNIHHLFYIFDDNKPYDTSLKHKLRQKVLLNYKNEFINYLNNYCKYNNLLRNDNTINYIVVDDFLINDFFNIIYFDTKINDYYEGCYIQLNGNKECKKTLDDYLEVLTKKNIKFLNVIISEE